MASVILHAYRQILETGKVRLFRSHRNDYKDGEQKRDFIYVKDLVRVCLYLMLDRKHCGLYNLGTGHARSWNDLAAAIFTSMQLTPQIEYIDIPEDIRETYQYFTEAKMEKLKAAGYTQPFLTIEEGVDDYIKNYLSVSRFY
jgi:ADP-L-glycero-D-manno-heptose 6-epimerase